LGGRILIGSKPIKYSARRKKVVDDRFQGVAEAGMGERNGMGDFLSEAVYLNQDGGGPNAV